jgi:hypothetical protein
MLNKFKKLFGRCFGTALFNIPPSKRRAIKTYIDWHIGDHLIHLNFLRKVAQNNPQTLIYHFVQKKYISEFNFYIGDLNNIKLYPLYLRPWGAVNAWKNYQNAWAKSDINLDFDAFHCMHFQKLSKALRIENPIKGGEDLLFDYSVIKKKNNNYLRYDWMIVNSLPLSSQFSESQEKLDYLCLSLSKIGSIITTRKVNGIPCTTDSNMSLREIANQAEFCARHLMISTGPSWLILNTETYNKSSGIYILHDDEVLNFGGKKVEMVRSVNQFIEILGTLK